jgi:co-chaperonin GroES (HSP10)
MLKMDDSKYVGKKRLIVTGDRLLVSPLSASERTHTGLYLPDSAVDGKQISSGWVEAIGPGYPVPAAADPAAEPWKQNSPREESRYFPLQAEKGDFVLYVKNAAYEVNLEGKKYFVVPNSAVLVLLREDDWDTASITEAEAEEED